MTYEYSLRRLFRDPIDHLPISEQLQYYNQRSLARSHVYRLGTSLFGGHAPTIRRRCIDATHYTAVQRTPHTSHVRPSQTRHKVSTDQNDDVVQTYDGAGHSTQTPLHWLTMRCGPEVGSNDRLHTAPHDDNISEVQYNKWLSHRRDMRGKLDNLGANRRWLLSKDCTPLENKLLSQLNKKQTMSMTDDKHVTLPEVCEYNDIHVQLTGQRYCTCTFAFNNIYMYTYIYV